jgi:hypothetical protein
MDNISDPALEPHKAAASAPRIPGYRYPTPTGEPCPRTIRTDGTIEFGGNCQSCGTCLLYGGLEPSEIQPSE